MELRPLDIQAALQGAPVLLRNGQSSVIRAYNPTATYFHRLIGWANDGTLLLWSDTGNQAVVGNECQWDIIGMAPRKETRSLWVNAYPSGNDTMHYSQANADRGAGDSRLQCIEVTYEVDL